VTCGAPDSRSAIPSSLINPLGFYKAKPWPFSGPLTIATAFEANSRFARSGTPLRRGQSVQGPADPTSAVLQFCASGADKFYLTTTASQTVTAFNSIGTSLSKSRVAR